MYFIEQFFDLSPDGGDGSLEFLLLASPTVLLLARAWWRRHQTQWQRHVRHE